MDSLTETKRNWFNCAGESALKRSLLGCDQRCTAPLVTDLLDEINLVSFGIDNYFLRDASCTHDTSFVIVWLQFVHSILVVQKCHAFGYQFFLIGFLEDIV